MTALPQQSQFPADIRDYRTELEHIYEQMLDIKANSNTCIR